MSAGICILMSVTFGPKSLVLLYAFLTLVSRTSCMPEAAGHLHSGALINLFLRNRLQHSTETCQSYVRFKQCYVETTKDKVLFQKRNRLPSIAICVISWIPSSDLLCKCDDGARECNTHLSQPWRQMQEWRERGRAHALVGVHGKTRTSFLLEMLSN